MVRIFEEVAGGQAESKTKKYVMVCLPGPKIAGSIVFTSLPATRKNPPDG